MTYKGILKHWATGMILIFCIVCCGLPAAGAERSAIIVYLHPVATDVVLLVDDIPVYRTEPVFGAWCYQFNLTAFLDTAPHSVTIKTRLKNEALSHCDIEVRKITENPAGTLLAEKTIQATDPGAMNGYQTAVSLSIALPEGSVRPLWAEKGGGDLTQVSREGPGILVKEIFSAIRKHDTDALMPLITPALYNQARMEGVPPDLLRQAMKNKLMRYGAENLPIAATLAAFSASSFSDIMAPVNVDTLRYFFMQDPNSKDKRGNLFTPEEPVQFGTNDNHRFAARIFFSYADEKKTRVYVSRFLFEQTK